MSNDIWDERVAGMIAAVRHRLTGDYEVDEFGFDKHITDSVYLPVLRPLFRNWFRTEVSGAENIPVNGGALIVANHSGTVPLDALMLGVAVHEAAERYLRLATGAASLAFGLMLAHEIGIVNGLFGADPQWDPR